MQFTTWRLGRATIAAMDHDGLFKELLSTGWEEQGIKRGLERLQERLAADLTAAD